MSFGSESGFFCFLFCFLGLFFFCFFFWGGGFVLFWLFLSFVCLFVCNSYAQFSMFVCSDIYLQTSAISGGNKVKGFIDKVMKFQRWDIAKNDDSTLL